MTVEQQIYPLPSSSSKNAAHQWPLVSACRAAQPQVAVVHELLDNGADVNECNELRRTALHFATRRGAVEIVELLIERGADVARADGDKGVTPLMNAVYSNSIECVKAILNAQPDLFEIHTAQEQRKGVPTLFDVAREYASDQMLQFLENQANSKMKWLRNALTKSEERVARTHAQLHAAQLSAERFAQCLQKIEKTDLEAALKHARERSQWKLRRSELERELSSLRSTHSRLEEDLSIKGDALVAARTKSDQLEKRLHEKDKLITSRQPERDSLKLQRRENEDSALLEPKEAEDTVCTVTDELRQLPQESKIESRAPTRPQLDVSMFSTPQAKTSRQRRIKPDVGPKTARRLTDKRSEIDAKRDIRKLKESLQRDRVNELCELTLASERKRAAMVRNFKESANRNYAKVAQLQALAEYSKDHMRSLATKIDSLDDTPTKDDIERIRQMVARDKVATDALSGLVGEVQASFRGKRPKTDDSVPKQRKKNTRV